MCYKRTFRRLLKECCEIRAVATQPHFDRKIIKDQRRMQEEVGTKVGLVQWMVTLFRGFTTNFPPPFISLYCSAFFGALKDSYKVSPKIRTCKRWCRNRHCMYIADTNCVQHQNFVQPSHPSLKFKFMPTPLRRTLQSLSLLFKMCR